MNITPYTSITNNKDTRTDDVLVLSSFDKFKSDVYNAKIYKILPHKFIDYDISIWMDGNMAMKFPKEKLVNDLMGDAEMALFKHYKSKGIEWELKWIKYKFGRHSPVSIEAEKQVEKYLKEGMTPKTQMYMGGIIFRRNTKAVNAFNEDWWSEICCFGQRDQLSLPIVLARHNLKLKVIELNIKDNEYFTYNEHNYLP
jgi:hypothetical protein